MRLFSGSGPEGWQRVGEERLVAAFDGLLRRIATEALLSLLTAATVFCTLPLALAFRTQVSSDLTLLHLVQLLCA